MRYMYTYKNSFFTVLLWGGWLIANIKLQKSLLVGHTVAHVVKKRETRYDKEKARLKVVLFLSVPPPRLLLPAFEVGKNFKRLLLCSRSPPFFCYNAAAVAFMKKLSKFVIVFREI